MALLSPQSLAPAMGAWRGGECPEQGNAGRAATEKRSLRALMVLCGSLGTS